MVDTKNMSNTHTFENETFNTATILATDLTIGSRVVFGLGLGVHIDIFDIDTVTSIENGVAWFDQSGIEMIDGREVIVVA